jgi:hypothetical protein
MDSLLGCSYDERELKRIGAWPDPRHSPAENQRRRQGGNMSDETAREMAEREMGRAEDKRKTPERRAYRTGDGRRGKSGSKARKQATEESAASRIPPRSPAGREADQRRFHRV